MISILYAGYKTLAAFFASSQIRFTPKDIFAVKNIGSFLESFSIFLICSSLSPVVAITAGILFFSAYDNKESKTAGFEKSIITSADSDIFSKLS